MTTLLDDPSTLVRRALAEALSSANAAPRHLVLALAGDRSDVAAAVLQRSPVLTDADLVDCAAIGDAVAQSALARRPNLSPGVTAALAEVGERDAILTLISNREVNLWASPLGRIFARFGDDVEVRVLLLQRPPLPAGSESPHRRGDSEGLGKASLRRNGCRASGTEPVACERATRRSVRSPFLCTVATS